MSLVITGTNLTIALFLLIAINGFLIIKKIPILAFSIVGISVIFLLVFPMDLYFDRSQKIFLSFKERMFFITSLT